MEEEMEERGEKIKFTNWEKMEENNKKWRKRGK
jgi:hypothetical protein